MQLERILHHISNLYQNIHFIMEEESNGELAFLNILLKQNNGEISALVWSKPTHTGQYLNYSSHHQTSCKEGVISILLNRAYSTITNKDDLNKKTLKLSKHERRMVMKKVICKIFKRITNNHNLPESQKQTQTPYIQ